jgi:hypothetical protein
LELLERASTPPALEDSTPHPYLKTGT